MRVAIVGAGVSGLVCAHRLRESHDVTLFEGARRLGGHTNTVEVRLDGRTVPVDTGFIVFNEGNYPNFTALLRELGVRSAPTTMSFSVRDDETGFEYGGNSLGGLLARKRNAVSPSFWRMLRDIKRFGDRATADARLRFGEMTLGEYLADVGYSEAFVERYLVPMASSIWSAPRASVRSFPFAPFVRFFDNHGMLRPWKAPRWRYVVGGSSEYVRAIAAGLGERVRVGSPVVSVRRDPWGVTVETGDGRAERFDEVVMATHSDQALRLLVEPSEAEREALGAIPYQANDVVLHTDASLLPRRRRAWSAWNYLSYTGEGDPVAATYHMNTLQRLPVRTPACVTLNATGRIDPERIVGRWRYDHPVYTGETFEAQRRWGEVSGADRVHFCGAYWGYGFHEDGVRSALRVCAAIGEGAAA